MALHAPPRRILAPMPGASPPSLRWALRVGGLACLWLAVVLLMVRAALGDPPDPTRVGAAAYGHDAPGALLHGVLLTFSELILLYAILRPWSYRRSWGRALAALALLHAGHLDAAVLALHAGPVLALHLLWVALCALIVLGLALASGLAALRARRS